jgi:hypothetical protein
MALNLFRDIFPAARCVLLICFLSTTNTPQLAAGIFYFQLDPCPGHADSAPAGRRLDLGRRRHVAGSQPRIGHRTRPTDRRPSAAARICTLTGRPGPWPVVGRAFPNLGCDERRNRSRGRAPSRGSSWAAMVLASRSCSVKMSVMR